MTTRAFGALHANLAVATLAAVLREEHLGLALRANLAADIGDRLGPLLEWRFGDVPSRLALSNTAVQGGGIVLWTAAMRSVPDGS